MDSLEKEQLFDAIYMAIQHGYIDAARRAFYQSLECVVNRKLDEVARLVIENDPSHLVDEINRLKI